MFPPVAKKSSSTLGFPDVCLTPVAGPVPIPYPATSMIEGARTGLETKNKVLVGKQPAVKSSKVVSSKGDEAGTAGGLVSGTVMGAARHKANWTVNAAPPLRCGNPACQYHMHAIPATQTATLPHGVKVDFPSRVVCLSCYRAIVGEEPLPPGSAVAPSQTKVRIAP